VTCLTWPKDRPNEVVFGLADGKVRMREVRCGGWVADGKVRMRVGECLWLGVTQGDRQDLSCIGETQVCHLFNWRVEMLGECGSG